ncbi:MAG: DNA mismatch endonuclease Vsr [Bacteroidales bacterium]|nr:DNA mismatch endonuclease Vsr [Bacteroidales bacterium]
MKVRKWLGERSYRYRLNVKGVPGKPDIVMRRYRTAVFVNGCFWHGHEGCEKSKLPQTNVEFWKAKIERNKERDNHNYQILRENGWQVLVLWECQLIPRLFETTMQQVEVMLHDYCLKTISPKVKEYIRVDEESISMVAEAEYDYGE